ATAVYALAGDADYAAGDAFRTLALRHEEILAAYRAGDFAVAASKAAAAESVAPDDLKGLYRTYYKQRFAELAAAGVGADWESVLRLETK
ncbi:MAG TPA: hypothetical protein VKU03_11170, partial [Roseiarcus sp.]|nr:hypothetical protein [Roseiarcus sp.]